MKALHLLDIKFFFPFWRKSKQVDVLLSNSIDDSQRNSLRLLSENKQIKEGISPDTEISFISLRTNKYPLNNQKLR